MTKKILILSGSPRKGGNSDLLCDKFIKGATDAGHQTEKIYLRDKTINYCTGCGICNDTHKCILKDDMEIVLNKMVDADIIVMATPVYFYTMNAQMKTLIDRTVPRYTEISGKEFYFIIAAAENDKDAMERTIDGFRGFLDCLNNPKEKGVIYGINAWQIGEIQKSPAMQQAYEMGKSA